MVKVMVWLMDDGPLIYNNDLFFLGGGLEISSSLLSAILLISGNDIQAATVHPRSAKRTTHGLYTLIVPSQSTSGISGRISSGNVGNSKCGNLNPSAARSASVTPLIRAKSAALASSLVISVIPCGPTRHN